MGSIAGEGYTVLETIGQGGMAVVYRAIDRERGGEVAVKVITRIGDARNQKRLFNELLLSSTIQHPNVVAIRDFGLTEPGGRPFIVMDFMEGMDLGAYLERHSAIPPARLMRLFDGVLSALATLHKAGVVHKDIKPANIFLRRGEGEERLVLMDFGIAAGAAATRATRPGGMACTPQYSSPEYLLHQLVTPALDVYQMMLVFFEALLGRPLAQGKGLMGYVNVHLNGELALPPLLRQGPLAALVVRGLALEVEDRFADGDELLEAFRAIDPVVVEVFMEMLDALEG